MTGCVTRADLDCPTLGQPYEMSKNGLPSGIDVLRHWKTLKASVEKPGIISRRHDLTRKVVGDKVEICTSASIPYNNGLVGYDENQQANRILSEAD